MPVWIMLLLFNFAQAAELKPSSHYQSHVWKVNQAQFAESEKAIVDLWYSWGEERAIKTLHFINWLNVSPQRYSHNYVIVSATTELIRRTQAVLPEVQFVPEPTNEIHLLHDDPVIRQTFSAGNSILRMAALEILSPFNTKLPTQITKGARERFEKWKNNVVLSKNYFHAARYLIPTDVLQELEYELNQIASIAGLLQSLNERVISQQLVVAAKKTELLSSDERIVNTNLHLAESMLQMWEMYLNPLRDRSINEETRELIAHGYLMALGELELRVSLDEVSDHLNRKQAELKWITRAGSLGPIARELAGKLASYPKLLPVLRLALNAKLAEETGAAPTPSFIREYEQLPKTLSFEKHPRGKSARRVLIHFGSLENSRTTGLSSSDVWPLLLLIDRWFQKHGVVTHDWQSVEGTTLEFQRAALKSKRGRICEDLLMGWIPDRQSLEPRR